MARWSVRELTAVPRVTDGDPDDPEWHPLQHFFGIGTFGINLFVATRGDETLVEEHDEGASGQQELYLVLDGSARFDLDGERVVATRHTAVAVVDPAVRRSATALAPHTMTAIAERSGGKWQTRSAASTW
jgi:hypothetical protein